MRSDDPTSSNKCWQDVQRMEMTEIEILTLMASTVRRNYGGWPRCRSQREKIVVPPYAREGGALPDGCGGRVPAAARTVGALRPSCSGHCAPLMRFIRHVSHAVHR